MKSILMRLFAVLLCAAPLVLAQQTATVVAQVPFAFTAGNVNCQPGEYRLARVRAESPLLSIRNETTREVTVHMAGFLDYRQSGNAARLVFYRYGDRYFLREIHEGNGIAANLLPGPEERKLQVAGLQHTKTVVLARLRGEGLR